MGARRALGTAAVLVALAAPVAPALAGPGELLVRVRAAESPPAVPARTAPPARLAAPLEASRLVAEIGATLGPAERAALAAAAPLLAARAVPPALARGAAVPPAAAAAADRLARTYLLTLAPGADRASVLAALAAAPLVELAIENRTMAAGPMARAALPAAAARGGEGDPLRPAQWYLDRVGARDAWAVTRGRADVLVAVIDTGVNPHADLVANLWVNDDPPGNARPDDDGFDQDGNGAVEDWERDDDDDNGYVDDASGWDFVDAPRIGGPGDAVGRDPDVSDDSGHGTAVAGVIAAVADNGIGISGLAPAVTLMPVRAGFNPGLGAFSGVLEEDDAAAAIVYAAENGARVINMSFGDTLLSPIVADAVAYAAGLGAVLVGAAGNARADGMHYPSGLPDVIAVGATDYADQRASFSSYGAALDLVAPGDGILTTVVDGDEDAYVTLSGTSFAAPLVAAAAALLASRAPALGAAEIAALLTGSARDLDPPGFDLETANGRLDAGRALTVPPAASVAIHAPAGGAGIDASAPLVITAEGLRLAEYVVEAGAGRDPSAFTTLVHAGGRQVVADTVGVWETAALDPGEYTLRLRARDEVEGWRETRTLVTVDHTPPVIGDASVELLWVEERLISHVFFTTDDLARGRVDVYLPGSGSPRQIDEGFLTRDHVLRIPEDIPPGPTRLNLRPVNAAGLAGWGLNIPATVVAERAGTEAFTERARLLTDGELGPPIADLDQDEAGDLVVMAAPEEGGSPYGPLVIYEAAGADAWAERLVLPYRLLPRATGDTDADGRAEILASGAGSSWLLESRRPGAYPDSLVWADTTTAAGFAIGIAPLGARRGPSLLAIRGDSLLVYAPTGDAAAWTRAAYGNFSGSARSFTPTFFAGDVDGDAATELVIGDAGGRLLAFRAAEGLLEPVYQLALPAATGPRIAGGDMNGDDRPEVVVDLGVDLDLTSEALLARRRHLVLVYGARPGTGFLLRDAIGIAGVEPGGNAVAVAQLDADLESEIVVAAAPDLYVFDRTPDGDWLPLYYRAGVRSAGLALGDADRDGRLEIAARIDDVASGGPAIAVLEARTQTVPGPPPPSGLQATIAAGGAVDLAWNPGPGYGFRVYRGLDPDVACGAAALLAETTLPAYRDTTARGLDQVVYRVSAVDGSGEGDCTAPLVVRPGEAPLLLGAEPAAVRVVRVVYSQRMDESATRLENYRLDDDRGAAVGMSSVLAAGGDREFLLVLGRDLEPGATMLLRVGAVRGAGGAPLAGAAEITFVVPETLPRQKPLALESAAGEAGGTAVLLRLSAPPDSVLGADPAGYRASGGLAIAAAEVDGAAVTLRLDPATPLHPGIFRLALAPALRGAAGEAVVAGQGDEAELVIGGAVVLYPNPYAAGRAAADGVTAVGLAPGSAVQVLDAAGREVLRINARNDGTALIPVRGSADLASGVYVVRLTAADGDRTLRPLAVVR